MTETEPSTDEHMSRLASGDRCAFNPVFEALWPHVRAYTGKLLASAADADDAAQITMQKLFEQSGQYREGTRTIAWALTIAGWECRTIRRQRARRGDVNWDASSDQQADLYDPDPTRGDSPEDTITSRNLVAAARTVLGRLSELDQQTLLAAFEDDTDARTGIAPATFRKRYARALHRLRESWRSVYGY